MCSAPSAWSPRWSWRSPRCTSCALPLLDRLPHLPEPQREALETVFGIRAGAPPDRFLVGLAVLSLLSDVSEERPLLCVIDDAQWLDQASAQVLGFVARRLLAESIALVFAAREPGRELLGLPELELAGLPVSEARALLRLATPSRLDQRIRDRIVVETRGNPLALLELPRGLTVTQMAGGFGLLQAGTLPGHIEQSFLKRIEALPADARLLLLVAAAEPIGDPALVWRAAERLGVMPAAALASGTDGLLSVDSRVTFRHPLVRSAVYRAADARRSASSALGTGGGHRRPDRSRSSCMASRGGRSGTRRGGRPELEQSAGRAAARGGLAAAAAFLQRSRRADARPGASHRPCIVGGAGRPAGRCVRIRVGAACDRRGRRARRVRAGSGGPAAGGSRVRSAAWRRRAVPCCCVPLGHWSHSTLGSPVTPTSMRGARRCSPGGWRPSADLREVSRAARAAPPTRRARRVPRTCSSMGSRC